MPVQVRYIIVSLLICLPYLATAQSSFTDYDDVTQLLPFLTDVLPPELKVSDSSALRKAWANWVFGHDRDIRDRLLRGDEDTLINWLLFGTSFTQQPQVLFEVPATSDALPLVIARRIRDFVAAVQSPDSNERWVFARRLLKSHGQALERHLEAEVRRVIAERQEFMLREHKAPAGDVIGQIMVESTLFRDRGLSLDTSILSSFAVEQALEAMKNNGLVQPEDIRRVAIIGPGLDFADKNSGYDFYPVQTMQPFTTIDSLVRLGLSAQPDDIELTTIDISPRVNDHIQTSRNRASAGAPYVLRLPTDRGAEWTPGLLRYWKSIGDRIGSEASPAKTAGTLKGIELRTVEVRPQVAARITPVDFNVVTQKWPGPPFDLVVATNVFVYYDKLDQSLAFAGIEAMLRPGGFFITNNVVVEAPVSRLRSVGILTVQHSAEKRDHVFWYRRSAP